MPKLQIMAEKNSRPARLAGSACKRLAPRRGFTLIEIMVVIGIIGVLATLSVTVYIMQIKRADEEATRGVIKTIDSMLRKRLESSEYLRSRRTPVPAPATSYRFSLASAPGAAGEVEDRTANRAKLIGEMMVMRAEFPQQFVDFFYAHQGGLFDGADPTVSSGIQQGILTQFLRETKQLATNQPLDPNSKAYTFNIANHDPNTESAECLYLCLTAAKTEGMDYDVDEIPKQYIRDTDGDGLLEFVDSYGTPLRFYRWPTDYLAYLTDVSTQLPESHAVNQQSRWPNKYNWWQNPYDPSYYLTMQLPNKSTWFDQKRQFFEQGGFFRLHKLYRNRTINMQVDAAGTPYGHMDGERTVNLAQDEANPAEAWAYYLQPIIVSAGPDAQKYTESDKWKAFGLAWPQGGAAPTYQNIDARCARVGGTTQSPAGGFVPDPEMIGNATDNIVSVVIRAGGEK